MKLNNKFRKISRFNSLTHFTHQYLVVKQIVYGIETCAENFTNAMQMVQIRSREIFAGVASTGFVQRPRVIFIRRIFNFDIAMSRE